LKWVIEMLALPTGTHKAHLLFHNLYLYGDDDIIIVIVIIQAN